MVSVVVFLLPLPQSRDNRKMKEVICVSVEGQLSAVWDLAVAPGICDCHREREMCCWYLNVGSQGDCLTILSMQSSSDSPAPAMHGVKNGQMQGQATTIPPKSNLKVSTMT